MKVLMFHSIGANKSSWLQNWLSVDCNHFEVFCAHLKRKGYKTIFLSEWYKMQIESLNSKKNIIVLTFDDGYLDNWVYVFPMLKKYGLTGTIFINPEFVSEGSGLRPNMNSLQYINNNDKNKMLGYLNWDEIIEMDKSGVIDIQSHSMSHNYLFNSNKVIDIYTGQKEYDWLSWFLHPEKKPNYLVEDQSKYILSGYPIFEYDRALGLRRYIPDPGLIEYSCNLFTNKITRENHISALNTKLSELPGRFETDDEMKARYIYELSTSKILIEDKLKKKVEYLCWPGGGYNDLSVAISEQVGYKASTISSKDKYKKIDTLQSYKRIERVGMGSFMPVGKNRFLIKWRSYLICLFEGSNGRLYYKVLFKLLKISMVFCSKTRFCHFEFLNHK